jgi:hypothetical protein
MKCDEAEICMVEFIGRDVPPALSAHLGSCAACRARREDWNRLWRRMERWGEERPPDEAVAPILAAIRARLREEAAKRKAQAGGGALWDFRFALPAAVAALVSVGAAAAFHYESAARLVLVALGALGLSEGVPRGAIAFVVGCLYAAVPLFGAGLLAGRFAGGRALPCGAWLAVPFLSIALPYAVAACQGLGAVFLLSVVSGLAAGAFIGGLGGAYLGRRSGALGTVG